MAGTGHDQPGALAVGAETDVSGGAKPFLAVATHYFVDDPQHQPGAPSLDCGGPRRVANERRERSCLRALAADVADDDRPVVAGALEHVVEISADVAAGARRSVVGRDLDAGDRGKVRRKEALLERLGQPGQPGATGTELPFGLRALDELADLGPGGIHHRENVLIGGPALRREELEHA